ncbi:type I-E CRISPR-associated protein Cas7/Cse4/CasC [Micrococcales bacterium 31B]|nr:type I-E CRISPR-associated protein Cas7/Cse4/CasC [Micrococcales bacterium 31B]
MTLYIDIHALQSVPPSNINRDDTGAPKSAIFGGKLRHRVSSQSWKKATRDHFKTHLDASRVGHRTLHVVEAVAHAIQAKNPDLSDSAERLAESAFAAMGVKVDKKKPKGGESDQTMAKSGALFFLSALQIEKLADAAIAAAGASDVTAELKARKIKSVMNLGHSFDIALFGRMVADSPDINVDAACQVAHALSVHEVQAEGDYYTAVDDREKENNAGADMIGVVEYASSTLYRYATINVDALKANLGDETAVSECIDAFIAAFTQSMPTGKQNTFGNRTLPAAVLVSLRDDQPINYVNAFEDAVVSRGHGYMKPALAALVKEANGITQLYGVPAVKNFVARTVDVGEDFTALGEVVTLKDLGSTVAAAVVNGN